MSVIWVAGKAYRRVDYESEADLETAIIEVQHRLFGPNRFYLDVKNKIGTKESIQNIPDGYGVPIVSCHLGRTVCQRIAASVHLLFCSINSTIVIN